MSEKGVGGGVGGVDQSSRQQESLLLFHVLEPCTLLMIPAYSLFSAIIYFNPSHFPYNTSSPIVPILIALLRVYKLVPSLL
jgi:hypothetical protein